MKDSERRLLTELRRALLPLHKTLLEWERKTYEREHGRKMGGGELLQVIMTAPQFAWLHPISELIVRIDQTVEPESVATEADSSALVDQVEGLLTASEHGTGFQRRYYDALQRQPAVVLAHADVRRTLKSMR